MLMFKIVFAIASFGFAAARVYAAVVGLELNKHLDQSFQAAAHVWIGILIGCIWLGKRIMNNVRADTHDSNFAAQAWLWLDGCNYLDLWFYVAWLAILSIVELVSALVIPRVL